MTNVVLETAGGQRALVTLEQICYFTAAMDRGTCPDEQSYLRFAGDGPDHFHFSHMVVNQSAYEINAMFQQAGIELVTAMNAWVGPSLTINPFNITSYHRKKLYSRNVADIRLYFEHVSHIDDKPYGLQPNGPMVRVDVGEFDGLIMATGAAKNFRKVVVERDPRSEADFGQVACINFGRYPVIRGISEGKTCVTPYVVLHSVDQIEESLRNGRPLDLVPVYQPAALAV